MMNSLKKTVFVSSGAVVALALVACGSAAEQTSPAPASTSAAAADSTTAAPSSASAAATSTSPSTEGTAEAGPLLAAIEQALVVRPGGTVVQVDEEDDTQDSFDVDLVLDGVKHEFTVRADGSIVDEQTDQDSDEIARAAAAQVLAADAVTTAAEGRGGQVATDIDLDDQNGALVWEVDFEDANGNDTGSVKIDALTGEVVPQS